MPIVGSFAGASSRAYGLQAGIGKGDFYSISSTTVGTATGTVTIDNIPSTYQHLQVRLIARSDSARTNDLMVVRFNNDSSTTYYSGYFYGAGSTRGANWSSATYYQVSDLNAGNNTANAFGCAILDIFDYANTNKFKVCRGYALEMDASTSEVFQTNAIWPSTSAITSISFTFGGVKNIVANSTFAVYGVK